MQLFFRIPKACCTIYSNGCKSQSSGLTTRNVASRKLVGGNSYSEGSETAKFGTDEQKVHKRHKEKDEYTQQYNVQSHWLTGGATKVIFFM